MADTVVDTAGLTVTEHLCDPLWQITLWPGRSRPGLPEEPGRIAHGTARMGPLSWVVFEGNDEPVLDPEDGAVTDISHSRKRFRIEGDRAREVMMRLAPLDVRDRSFPDGAIKATSAHHISVWIARDGDAWDVYAGFTFSQALREVIEETAAQWESA